MISDNERAKESTTAVVKDLQRLPLGGYPWKLAITHYSFGVTTD
jgi:hypothetical protein